MSPFNLLRRLWLVFAAALALAGCDCGRECTSNSDCADQGPNYVCQAGRCVDATPDAGPQCSPACPTNQFCETATLTCKSCTATRGCTGTQVCDTAANGGAGQCRNCVPAMDGGVARGCNSQFPACDTAANGGNGQCITCNAGGGCFGSLVCDTAADGGVCRNCLTGPGSGVAPGCTAGAPVCNQTASGGLGACRACVISTDGGVAPGCSTGQPVCDTAGAGGLGACVLCSSVQGCPMPLFCETTAAQGQGQCRTCSDSMAGGGIDRGCATGQPVCDVAVDGGVCTLCLPSADGGQAPGCSAGAPICDPAGSRCLTCTATAGCGGATPVCDTAAGGGVGTCRTCLVSAMGTAPGCSAGTPICDPAGGGGNGACVICSAAQGCTSPQFCDTAAGSGAGMCKNCTDTVSTGQDRGCTSGAPVCDIAANMGAGACVGCLISGDCTVDPNRVCDQMTRTCKVCVLNPAPEGCAGSQVCDPTANGGQGACLGCAGDGDCMAPTGRCRTSPPPGTCVECLAGPDCTNPQRPACRPNNVCGCSASGDCTAPNGVCDTAANSGNGRCVVCTATEGCAASQVCDTAANGGAGQCLGCAGDGDCMAPTGRCRTSPPPGTCVECLGNPDCAASRPVCQADNVCGCNVSGDCPPATPLCDPAANGGHGTCQVCIPPTTGCTDPNAPFCNNGTECICRNNADCDANETCTGTTPTCQPDDPAPGSAGITAFRAAPAGAVTISIPGVYVTYLKPPLGSAPNDVPGFFVQAEANGPAMFVSVNPAMLVPPALVGDRVSFQATNKVFLSNSGTTAAVDTASAISGWTILSSGHPVQNLNTASPAGLTVDRTLATDLVTALESYESELIRLTGDIAGAFVAAGSPHFAAPLNTAGVTGDVNLQIRLPDALISMMELTPGCRITITHGPVWRFTSATANRAQPSAYSAQDITVIACPAPRVLSAFALSDTSVEVAFDRSIDPASVQPTDFTITGLTVSGAVASGRTVRLATSAQTQDQPYTVTVGGVTDTYGTAVDPSANTAGFYGYAPASASAGLVINEIDYDQNINPDSTEFVELVNTAAGPVSISGLEMLLVNGGNTTTPRREYARYRLAGVTDGTNPVITVPPGGVVVVGAPVVVNALPPGTLRLAITTATGGVTDIIQNAYGGTPPLQSDGVGILHFAAGTIIDTLYYEPSAQSAVFNVLTGAGDVSLSFVEGMNTQFEDPFNTVGSVQRKKNASVIQDTGDNSMDFELVTTPTPGTP